MQYDYGGVGGGRRRNRDPPAAGGAPPHPRDSPAARPGRRWGGPWLRDRRARGRLRLRARRRGRGRAHELGRLGIEVADVHGPRAFAVVVIVKGRTRTGVYPALIAKADAASPFLVRHENPRLLVACRSGADAENTNENHSFGALTLLGWVATLTGADARRRTGDKSVDLPLPEPLARIRTTARRYRQIERPFCLNTAHFQASSGQFWPRGARVWPHRRLRRQIGLGGQKHRSAAILTTSLDGSAEAWRWFCVLRLHG